MCLFTSAIPMVLRKYRVGRRRALTLHASNLGRRFMTLFRSVLLTLTSRRRKVKTGRMSEEWEVRISGHMDTSRRNSAEVKLMEVIKSTLDLMSEREADMTEG